MSGFDVFLHDPALRPVLWGLGAGFGATLLGLLVFSLVQADPAAPGQRSLKPGALLAGAFTSLNQCKGQLARLLIVITGLTTGITTLDLMGLPGMSIGLMICAAALVFLGHRALLKQATRLMGHVMPSSGMWLLLVTNLLFGLIILVVAGFLAALALLAYTVLNSLMDAPGSISAVLAFLVATILVLLSPLAARMSFAFPAISIGFRYGLGTAASKSAGLGVSLASALWVTALVSHALIFGVSLGLQELIWTVLGYPTPEADLTGFAPHYPSPSETAFWVDVVLFTLPTELLNNLYILISVAVLSTAYERRLLDDPGLSAVFGDAPDAPGDADATHA